MQRRPILEDPKMRLVQGLLSPAECDRIIEAASPDLEPALMFNSLTGVAERSPQQTNSRAALSPPAGLQEAIASATGAPIGAHDPLPIVNHYKPGEIFAAHMDALRGDAPGVLKELEERGQRLATMLIYLNDDYGGARPSFPSCR